MIVTHDLGERNAHAHVLGNGEGNGHVHDHGNGNGNCHVMVKLVSRRVSFCHVKSRSSNVMSRINNFLEFFLKIVGNFRLNAHAPILVKTFIGAYGSYFVFVSFFVFCKKKPIQLPYSPTLPM
jgi:hypothetical protein